MKKFFAIALLFMLSLSLESWGRSRGLVPQGLVPNFSGPVSWAESDLRLQLAPTTRVVLPNGLTILIRERREADNVGLSLMIGAGQLTEEESQMGITNVVQNYLLEEPVENSHDAATAVESQGGVIGASSGPDSSEINLDVTSGEFPFGLKVLSDLAHLQSIRPKIFHEVRENALEEIRRESEESYSSLYGYFLQEFYTFHPYKVPVVGLAATVKSLRMQDALDYYSRYYVPNNMVLSVVGNVETDRVIKLVSRYFSDLKKKPVKSKDIYYQPILDERKQVQLQESGNIAWLFVGFSAPEFKNEEYPAMEVINSILGASMSSRIWLSIREKHGLSYELGSQYSARQGPSHFVIYVATSPENLKESKGHLLKEVDRIRQEILTPQEIAITKRRLVGQFILHLETNMSQAQFLSHSELFGKGMMFDEGYIRQIEDVTPAEVLKVAKKYLDDYILISVE